jgi:capsular polysaccharide biosynthesis protein
LLSNSSLRALGPGALTTIIGTTAIAAVIGLLVSLSLPRTFEARVVLLAGPALHQPDPEYTQLLAAPILAQTYGQLTTTHAFLSRTIAELELDLTSEELAARTRVVSSPDTSLLAIEVDATNARQASLIANHLADQLVAATSAAEPGSGALREATEADLAAIDAEIERLEATAAQLANSPTTAQAQRMDLLLDNAASLRVERIGILLELGAPGGQQPLEIVSRADIPEVPAGPAPLVNAALAGAAGLIVGILLVWSGMPRRP